jgi:hypothetical protein
MTKIKTAFIIAAFLYCVVSATYIRFNNPSLTETELLINFWQFWLLWITVAILAGISARVE